MQAKDQLSKPPTITTTAERCQHSPGLPGWQTKPSPVSQEGTKDIEITTPPPHQEKKACPKDTGTVGPAGSGDRAGEISQKRAGRFRLQALRTWCFGCPAGLPRRQPSPGRPRLLHRLGAPGGEGREEGARPTRVSTLRGAAQRERAGSSGSVWAGSRLQLEAARPRAGRGEVAGWRSNSKQTSPGLCKSSDSRWRGRASWLHRDPAEISRVLNQNPSLSVCLSGRAGASWERTDRSGRQPLASLPPPHTAGLQKCHVSTLAGSQGQSPLPGLRV